MTRAGVGWARRLALALLLVALGTQPTGAAASVPAQWAQANLTCLVGAGVLGGPSQDVLQPDAPITRAAAARLWVLALHRGGDAAVLKGVAEPFPDVDPASDDSPYIVLAWETGLMIGDPDGQFRPADTLTRLEMVTLATRALALAQGRPLPAATAASGSPLPFADARSIDAWGRPYVTAAVAEDLARGYPDGTFRPQNPVTVAETATLASRVMTQTGLLYPVYGQVTDPAQGGGVSLFGGGKLALDRVLAFGPLFLNGNPATPELLLPGDVVAAVPDSGRGGCVQAWRTGWRASVQRVSGQAVALQGVGHLLTVNGPVYVNGQPGALTQGASGMAAVAIWSPAEQQVDVLDLLPASALQGVLQTAWQRGQAVQLQPSGQVSLSLPTTAQTVALVNGRLLTDGQVPAGAWVRVALGESGTAVVVDAWVGVSWR